METKKCIKCGEVKDVGLFFKEGLLCKECYRLYKKKYYQKNKEYYQLYQKKYYQKNKEIITERAKKWQQENKKRYDECKKKWKQENKESSYEYKNKYMQENEFEINKRRSIIRFCKKAGITKEMLEEKHPEIAELIEKQYEFNRKIKEKHTKK